MVPSSECISHQLTKRISYRVIVRDKILVAWMTFFFYLDYSPMYISKFRNLCVYIYIYIYIYMQDIYTYICTTYYLSGRVVSDIQTRAEGEKLHVLYVRYNTDANIEMILGEIIIIIIEIEMILGEIIERKVYVIY